MLELKNVGHFLLKTAHHPFQFLTVSVHDQMKKLMPFILRRSDHHGLRSGFGKCPDQEVAIVSCENDLSFLYKHIIYSFS